MAILNAKLQRLLLILKRTTKQISVGPTLPLSSEDTIMADDLSAIDSPEAEDPKPADECVDSIMTEISLAIDSPTTENPRPVYESIDTITADKFSAMDSPAAEDPKPVDESVDLSTLWSNAENDVYESLQSHVPLSLLCPQCFGDNPKPELAFISFDGNFQQKRFPTSGTDDDTYLELRDKRLFINIEDWNEEDVLPIPYKPSLTSLRQETATPPQLRAARISRLQQKRARAKEWSTRV